MKTGDPKKRAIPVRISRRDISPIQQANFWKRVTPIRSGECWLWNGPLTASGYGKSAGNRMSHRVAYAIVFGEVPEDMCVLHRCDVRRCCNPTHLFLGSLADNMHDRSAKMRQPHGEVTRNSKLKSWQVLQIREMCAAGVASYKDIAASFGVTQPLVTHIATGKRWAHLGGPRTHHKKPGCRSHMFTDAHKDQ